MKQPLNYEDLKNYIENKKNPKYPFVNFLYKITQIIREYKPNSEYNLFNSKIKDHLYHEEELKKSLRDYLKIGKRIT